MANKKRQLTPEEAENFLNRLNKRLERASKAFGTANSFYQSMAREAMKVLPPALRSKRSDGTLVLSRSKQAVEYVTTKGNAYAVDLLYGYSVQTGPNAKNLTTVQIDSFFDRYNQADERAYMKQQIENMTGKTKGLKKADYVQASNRLTDLGAHFEEAIEYIYAFADQNELDDAKKILEISGRKKSSAEMATLIAIAIEVANQNLATGSIQGIIKDFYTQQDTLRPWEVSQYRNGYTAISRTLKNSGTTTISNTEANNLTQLGNKYQITGIQIDDIQELYNRLNDKDRSRMLKALPENVVFELYLRGFTP